MKWTLPSDRVLRHLHLLGHRALQPPQSAGLRHYRSTRGTTRPGALQMRQPSLKYIFSCETNTKMPCKHVCLSIGQSGLASYKMSFNNTDILRHVILCAGNCSVWRHSLPLAKNDNLNLSSSTSSDFTFRFIRSSHIKSNVSPHAVLGKYTLTMCKM